MLPVLKPVCFHYLDCSKTLRTKCSKMSLNVIFMFFRKFVNIDASSHQHALGGDNYPHFSHYKVSVLRRYSACLRWPRGKRELVLHAGQQVEGHWYVNMPFIPAGGDVTGAA